MNLCFPLLHQNLSYLCLLRFLREHHLHPLYYQRHLCLRPDFHPLHRLLLIRQRRYRHPLHRHKLLEVNQVLSFRPLLLGLHFR